jgi:hypothetical protein
LRIISPAVRLSRQAYTDETNIKPHAVAYSTLAIDDQNLSKQIYLAA